MKKSELEILIKEIVKIVLENEMVQSYILESHNTDEKEHAKDEAEDDKVEDDEIEDDEIEDDEIEDDEIEDDEIEDDEIEDDEIEDKFKNQNKRNKLRAFFLPSERDILQISFNENMPTSSLERSLYLLGSKFAGPRLIVHFKTVRELQSLKNNPNKNIYLYIGKLDPESVEDENVYLLSTEDLNYAKQNLTPVKTKYSTYYSDIPVIPSDNFFAQKIKTKGSIAPSL